MKLLVSLLALSLLVACGDGDPAGPGSDRSPAATRLEIIAPDTAFERETFELTLSARTEGGEAATDFSATATLSVSEGTIAPSSVDLSAGSATTTVSVAGTTGSLTLTAQSGDLSGSADLTLIFRTDRLSGAPGDPAVEAIPALQYRVDTDDFTTGHPALPGVPMTHGILVLSLAPETTVGEANVVIEGIDGEIVGGIPGVAAAAPGILMIRVPTEDHVAMEALLEEVRTEPIVVTAVQDVLLTPDLVTQSNGGSPAEWEWASLAFGGNWGLKWSRVPQLWNLNPGIRKALASGSTSATGTLLLDGGFAPTHPDVGYSNLTPARVDAHGTAVAGIIGATHDNGVGIDGLNPFAVLTAFATESMATLLSDYAAQTSANPTIRVVNTSLGYNWHLRTPPVDSDADPAAQAMASRQGNLFTLGQRIVAARRPLPVVVTTAGNAGGRNARFNSPQANAALEHGEANIIVVEALANSTSASSGVTRPAYSNVNGHISAPGSGILSTGDSVMLDGYSTGDGTSFAAPHVAGLIGYLYTLNPGISDPTTTSNPIRDKLLGTAIPVPGGVAPRIDAYAAAHEVGDVEALSMLTDIDDGTPDGNLRVDPISGAVFLGTDADGDGGAGDGRVDMSDFRRWRDGYLFFESVPDVRLDGADDHPKKDLNGSGDVDFIHEAFFPFLDLNGDNDFDLAATAFVPGAVAGDVTDLQVLQQLFDDPHYDASELDGLIASADIAIHPQAVQAEGPAEIRSTVTAPGTTVPWQERVHSGAEIDGEGLYQVYTVPVGSAGEAWSTRIVALDGAGEIMFDLEDSFSVHPGEDHYWDPPTVDTATALIAWRFDADLEGWTAEERSRDGFPWGSVGWNERQTGVVLFDGVGYDGEPNSWIYITVDLPADAKRLRYRSSAHDRNVGAASLRIRLEPEGASAVIIQDWEELSTGSAGFEWIESTVDIAAWAGQTVTLYIEHADIDGGGNNQRWLDDIEILP